jgi:endonuclease/exonuclease/phosphatase (EEP) superfamily protein YafD
MDLLRAVAFLLAAGSALAAALALGGVISDKLDLFAQVAPAWLVCGLAALIMGSLVGQNRPGLALAAFAAIASTLLIAPDVVARLAQRTVPPRAQTVKLVQFNVWDNNRNPAATARWLADEKADILVLEEFGNHAVPKALAADYPFATECARDCGTIILSRTPPTGSGPISWPGLGSRHAGAWASFGTGAGAFTVAGTHYHWPIPPGPQADQIRRFTAALGPFDRQSLIIAADVNLNPWSFRLRRQDRAFAIPRITHAIFTWPAGSVTRWRLALPFPVLAVDQVWAGPAWKVVSVDRGPLLGSDHYPIVAVLTR